MLHTIFSEERNFILHDPLIVRLERTEWDTAVKGELERVLALAFDHPNVVIDMSAVTYMDSTCLAKLIRVYNEQVVKRGFRPARFVISSPNIRRLFTLVKFDDLWPVFATLEEALDKTKNA